MYQSSHIFHANVCKKILSMTHLHCGTNLIFPLHHLTQPSQNCSPACNEQIPEASEGNIRGVSKGSMFHSCWMWVIPCNLLKTTRIELTDTNQNSDSADCYFGGMYYKKLCVRPGRTLGCKSRVRHDCGAKPTKTPG